MSSFDFIYMLQAGVTIYQALSNGNLHFMVVSHQRQTVINELITTMAEHWLYA
jgi:hypothetical protein